MPFNGSGAYVPPSPPVFPAVSGTKIKAADFNSIISDLGTALSTCLTRDGQSVVTNNLPMNGFRITGAANASDDADLATFGQVKRYASGTYATVSGLTNADVTLTPLQYNSKVLRVTGALTADVDLIFPAAPGEWVIVNATTGSYSLTCKNATGAGIAVAQGKPSIIFSDGTDFFSTLAEYATLQALFAPLNQLPTGTLLHVHAATAPAGTVEARGDYTLGSAASGATYAFAGTADLYALMWANNANPIYTSGGAVSTRGASAAADFYADKRIAITENRARFSRALDNGIGLDASRVLGSAQADAFQGHEHEISDVQNCDGGSYPGGGNNAWTRQTAAIVQKSGYSVPRVADETRPMNVAHLAVYKL